MFKAGDKVVVKEGQENLKGRWPLVKGKCYTVKRVTKTMVFLEETGKGYSMTRFDQFVEKLKEEKIDKDKPKTKLDMIKEFVDIQDKNKNKEELYEELVNHIWTNF